MRTPEPHFAHVWVVLYAVGVVCLLPLEFFGVAWWSTAAGWSATVGLVVFFAVEWAAKAIRPLTRDYSGMLTEFTQYHVRSSWGRYAAGVFFTVLVLWRVVFPFNWIVGAFLWAWLPIHYLDVDMERRVAASWRHGAVRATLIVFAGAVLVGLVFAWRGVSK